MAESRDQPVDRTAGGESPSGPQAAASKEQAADAAVLGSGGYEILRQRLLAHANTLRERMNLLDARRREVFGSIETKILQADRVTTAHNCVPRDMARLGPERFLFAFNARFGLKKEIELEDVFAVYERCEETGGFRECDLEDVADPRFQAEFKRLYNIYEKTVFSRFAMADDRLFMVFRTGTGANDIAVFKWVFAGGGIRFVEGRAEQEYRSHAQPPRLPFTWQTPDREAFRYGDHPHVSIEDRVFVECVGGDLTIKVEDNTDTGEGVYSEPVEDARQKVDDAEIAYARVGGLVILRIRPYKEKAQRRLIFNEKTQKVDRVDSIGDACALLPEDHGLIFPDGYYLATGELKRFESRETGMVFDRVVHAPNGEDSLFVFYEPTTGTYVLMAYQLIRQKVDERIVCKGFTLFPDGRLLLLHADPEPQKHHVAQLRQTPFHDKGHEPPGQREAFLYRIGNKQVVRCLAECNEVISLIGRESPYAELYADVVRRCETILDANPWLADSDGFQIDQALRDVREAADQTVDEFDKVRRLQREAAQKVREARARCQTQFGEIRRASFAKVEDFVNLLTALRRLRGELIALRDTRYADLDALGALESEVAGHLDDLGRRCAAFLATPKALDPYRARVAELAAASEKTRRAAEGRKHAEALGALGADLEMLIEVVNGLALDDAAETTRIIDGITGVYSILNQAKAELRKRLQSLAAEEGAAQFAAQMKLLGQSASSYLDLCDTPSKCEEYLNRVSVHLEEMEGAFADFPEHTAQIAERRAELYEAFEQRKLALVEQRSRKAAALMDAAERILRVIRNRLAACATAADIQAYVASDPMVSKVRDTVAQLLALEDPVRGDDLDGRLKAAQQDALRQLRDRQELFVDGARVIRFGRHRFNVNTQPLDLTVAPQDGAPCLHLTGTKYFEPITDAEFLALTDVGSLEVVSETPDVYRGEYLAWRLIEAIDRGSQGAPDSNGHGALPSGISVPSAADVLRMTDEERLGLVQDYMTGRYREAYAKGLHDVDAARILQAALASRESLGLARFPPEARACATVYWRRFCPEPTRRLWTAKLRGFAGRNRVFGSGARQDAHIEGLRLLLESFARETRLYPESCVAPAAEHLFYEVTLDSPLAATREADAFAREFRQQLAAKGAESDFAGARKALESDPVSELGLVRDWARGFLSSRPDAAGHFEEAVALLFCEDGERRVASGESRVVLEGMKGSHPRIEGSRYVFDHFSFTGRLARHDREVAPRFELFQARKQSLLGRERKRLRLDELRPRVLSSFVRNQLIDRVYLPLVGENLAKQIGAAGDQKRTDRMGLLLVISPPGYGKTTLMEYVANRLGLVFVKINGPALGHGVTSLDPEEAPNASAREEIIRLNLALEMGDNVMICVDDIQHCHPEFLQKFISLCDAQRKIEGVWKGAPRTHDLRGRKVAVVMAGNPYTESGQKFKIPDMLANRADTYNLGDIIGGNAEWFRASYIENAITSNPVLAPLASRGQKDVPVFIRMAESGGNDAGALEGSYSPQEIAEYLAVFQKLVAIREVILRVNHEYIQSAGQSDEFRTEPPFRLQGSYRNMNRLAEKVVPVMNDAEIQAVIVDHYTNEAQTLTTGAEANLLKFKELIGVLTPGEAARWEEIRKTFRRNQMTRGADTSDPMGRIAAQLAGFHGGLESLRDALVNGVARAAEPAPAPPAPPPLVLDFGPVAERLDALRDELRRVSAGRGPADRRADEDRIASLTHELEMLHSTLATVKDLAAQQRDHLRSAIELLTARARQGTVEFELTQEMLANEQAFLQRFHEALEARRRGESPPGSPDQTQP